MADVNKFREALIKKVQEEEYEFDQWLSGEPVRTAFYSKVLKEEQEEAFKDAFLRAAAMLKGNPYPCNDTLVMQMSNVEKPVLWFAEKLLNEPRMPGVFQSILDDSYEYARKHNDPERDAEGLLYVNLKRPFQSSELRLYEASYEDKNPQKVYVSWYVPLFFDADEVFEDIRYDDDANEILNVYALYYPDDDRTDMVLTYQTFDSKWLDGESTGTTVELRVALDQHSQKVLNELAREAYARFCKEENEPA